MIRLFFFLFLFLSLNSAAQTLKTDRVYFNYLLQNDSISFQDINLRGFDLNISRLESQVFLKNNNPHQVLKVSPIVNLNGGNTNYQAGLGASLTLNTQKWKGFVAPSFNSLQLSWLDDSLTRSTEIIPSLGWAGLSTSSKNIVNIQLPWAIQYTPSKYFNSMVGNGNQFIGPGKSSIQLTDVSRNHLFGAITTQAWKLRYTNLFSGYSQTKKQHPLFGLPNKFTTSHILEFIPNDKLSIGFFETVVWKNRDTLIDRGFDVNYLNPIIFYRPVEYSTGSSDNVLLGLNFSYTPNYKLNFYGQFLLDEFFFKYVRADIIHFIDPNRPTEEPPGWWANKHAGQIGAQWKSPFGFNKFLIQSEYNYARPYTYTHLGELENYGSGNLPLAHPLGANFTEWFNAISLVDGLWYFEVFSEFSSQGLDYWSNENFGANIFDSYLTREMEFGNYMLQGKESNMVKIGFVANYLIIPETNISATFRFTHLKQNLPGGKNLNLNLFNIGIRSNLFNDYRDI